MLDSWHLGYELFVFLLVILLVEFFVMFESLHFTMVLRKTIKINLIEPSLDFLALLVEINKAHVPFV